MLRKLPGKLQETSLSQPFFPSNKGRYACKLGDRFPKGILLTTHDHALLTKNFCALAPEYKGTLSHLEERAQRAHYRTCYAWHARTCADRRARRVFWHLPFFKFPQTLKKGALVSNPHFTRGFRPEGGPASTREHFHSMRKVIPDISILSPKVSIFEKNANWKIPKNSSGHKPNPAFSDRK